MIIMRKIHVLSLIFSFVILALPLFTYAQKAQYHFDFSGKEQKAEEIKLSSIADDIEYIALETTPESYLSKVRKLTKTNEFLLVLDITNNKSNRLIIFGLDGSYISQIHRVGKGPGEYTQIEDFTFDPRSGRIVILDSYQKKLLEFSSAGEFLRETYLDFRPYNICFVLPNYIALSIPLKRVKPATDGKQYNLILLNREMKVVQELASSIEYKKKDNSSGITVGGLDSFENRLRFKQQLVDTIFTLNQEALKIPFYSFDFGKYKVPLDMYSDKKSANNIAKYKEYVSFAESNNYLFIRYIYENDWCYYLIRKSDSKMQKLPDDTGNMGFDNDFDGSMPFWPRVSTGNGELINYYNAIDLMEYCEKNNVRKFKSEFPKQQKKLLKLLDEIDEESNPIIQIVKMKR